MIEQEDYALKSECLFQAKKWNTILFKQFLGLLENLRQEHQINFDKLKNSLPEKEHKLIEMANYFDEKHYAVYRKKVLDTAGDCYRNLENDLKNI
jgi:endonuclease III-like uncharacterized protein